MTTTISADGLVRLPERFLVDDSIRPGQRCEISREGKGVYRLQIEELGETPNEGLVDLLLSCPVKGFFEPFDTAETTDDLKSVGFE